MRALVIFAALVFAPAASAQTLEDLSWLKGCWRSQGGGGVITEVWTAPPMPAMLGYSYTTRDSEVRDWEQTRIEIIDGHLTFVAMPRGAAPVRFRMVGLDAQSATFENPEHDYPQRVMYARTGNRLTATISRSDGSGVGTFQYRRISCGPALRP